MRSRCSHYKVPEWRIEHAMALRSSKRSFRRVMDLPRAITGVRRVVVWPDGRPLFLSINVGRCLTWRASRTGWSSRRPTSLNRCGRKRRGGKAKRDIEHIVEGSLVGVVHRPGWPIRLRESGELSMLRSGEHRGDWRPAVPLMVHAGRPSAVDRELQEQVRNQLDLRSRAGGTAGGKNTT